jgi:hypothetical protein
MQLPAALSLLTLINGCHTLVDLVHQAASQVLNVSTPLLTLLPGRRWQQQLS